ncbi:toxin ParE1/3/4 [Arenibacter algicola]|jgi:toxin ParE1/3/4|uniref:Toxin n=1 Tax=Arenibacter algicola TaxID=616991 RepID=A0A221UST1_9FLAO|nr:type II toxin-antitoxin system RelE/ParE family toxin [Arenibacter algicola]ASO04404.1 toxin ParE1 [Arenibacter algicola]HCO84129.1 type II toxin-antitoxin system RelE/ParE family toxin [Arenibacter sp.]|tara:strand:+ start:14132 stop:14434 length:303 start_codon:yes stop_codon:yes gene_type:complete
MSNNRFRISKQATNDLNDIWIYTLRKWSKDQADRYYNLIIEEIEFVADNFMTGKSVEQTRKGYRVTKIKSHLIFYKKAEDDIVEIIRILHQRMDIKKRLS